MLKRMFLAVSISIEELLDRFMGIFFSLLVFCFSWIFAISNLWAREFTTNEASFNDAPKWLRPSRVEKVTDRIQTKLEWSTRRVRVNWYTNQKEFEKVHGLGPLPLAVTQNTKSGSTVLIGPKVDKQNFDSIFGHELVHVIVFQKYRDAIPKWLEEGLANHLAKLQKVDYKWLVQQPFPKDIRELAHPLGGNQTSVLYRYKASQALAEFLDKKCGLENLIRLSVQRKMEDYILTYCEITDLNQAFQNWVNNLAGRKTGT